MRITSIGTDLGKNTFHLVAFGERNKILQRKKFSRPQLLAYTANLPASLVGLEASAGAHFVGAALREQGHQVRLIPAQFVKFDALLQDYLRRNRRLQRSAWLFTLVPVAVFAVLSLLVASKAKEYTRLSQESTQLRTTIQQQKAELEQEKEKSAVQQLAINIVKQQSPGVRPKVVVYRLAVAGPVEAALSELGYSVEQRVEQANPAS